MKRILIFLLLLSSFLAEARISFIDVNDLDTWEQMLQFARKQNQQVLVYVSTMVCSDCKKMRKTTFKDNDLSSYVNQAFLPLQVDAYSPVAQALNGIFEIKDLPAFLVLNAREYIFYEKTGFISANKMLADLKHAEQLANNYTKWQQGAVDGTLEKDEWIDFLLIEYRNNRVEIDNPIINSVSSLLDSSDFSNVNNLKFVQELGIDVDGAVFKTLLEKPHWITDTVAFSWEAYQQNVFNYNIFRAIKEKDSVLLEDILFQISKLKSASGISNLAFKGRQLYLAEQGKWENYKLMTRTYLDSLPVDSVNEYEVEAMHLMEHYPGPETGKLVLNFLKKGLDRRETFELYFALSLHFYNDYDYVNAYKSAYKAKELAESKDQENLARDMMRQIEIEY